MRRFFLRGEKGSILPRVAPELSLDTWWYYKAAHLIDQSWSVRAAGVRQRHIDQAQSMNLYITNDYTMRQVLALYLDAWHSGVKTIYYIRSKSLEVEDCEKLRVIGRSSTMAELKKKPLFNPEGDIDVRLRRMIGGNTTNLNDFNNMKYPWVSDWYRQAMNNFWIPEEINLSQDVKDYPRLLPAERMAYDKILSFLVFLDSIQTANLPNIGAYVTANEVNLCLSIQAFQECVHSQSYSYMLDTICSPVERNDILYQWKTDEHLLRRNTFIGNCYNEFQEQRTPPTLLRVMMANFILEGIYFYSGFMFFYNLSRNGKMPGSAQEIRYINRDENTHLWLFRNIILELQKEQPELFTAENVQRLREMMLEGVEQEIAWGALCHRGRGAGAEPPDGHGLHPLPRQSPLDESRVSGAISRLRARAGEHGMGQPVRRRQHGQDGFL